MLFAIALASSTNPRRKATYALLSGTFWGLSIVSQPYAVFLFAAVMLIPLHRRGMLLSVFQTACVAALVSLPSLLLLRQGQEYMGTVPPNMQLAAYRENGVPTGSASLPSVIGWSLTAWRNLEPMAQQILNDVLIPPTEALSQNWGLLVWLFAFPGVVVAIRERSALKLSVLSVLVVSFLLAAGPLWVDPPFRSELVVSVNKALWQLGQTLKPWLFDHWSSDLVDRALPLPALPLYMFVPRYEMARVPVRYLIVASYCAVILSVVFLSKLPKLWQVALSALWLLELLPMPTNQVPVPDAPHPAHVWFAQRFGTSAGVLSPAGATWV